MTKYLMYEKSRDLTWTKCVLDDEKNAFKSPCYWYRVDELIRVILVEFYGSQPPL